MGMWCRWYVYDTKSNLTLLERKMSGISLLNFLYYVYMIKEIRIYPTKMGNHESIYTIT